MRTRLGRVGFLLTGVAVFSSAVGASLDDAAERARAAANRLMTEHSVPAVAVAVAVNGKIVFEEAFGFADVETQSPATRETRFALGTMTKPFTTALLAKLVEQNVIEWDAPVERYVTEFPYYGKGVTLQRIASHQSGIGDTFAARNAGTREHFEHAKDALPYICSSPLLAPPGEATHYSTGAYTVLAAVVERQTKADFMSALREHVLEPLKLDTIDALDPHAEQENLATFYSAASADGAEAALPYDPSFQLAGAGLIGTAGDVATFVSRLNRGGFLRDSSIRQLFTAQPNKKGIKSPFGLGWSVGSKAGFDLKWVIGPDTASRDIVHHRGAGIGTSGWVALDRRTGIAVVVLSNLTEAPVAGSVFDDIFEAYLKAEMEIRSLGR